MKIQTVAPAIVSADRTFPAASRTLPPGIAKTLDGFVEQKRPFPGGPGSITGCFPPDFAYRFKVGRMGKEDLSAEKAKQEARAEAAMAQRPPDLRTYMDATSKVKQIEAEQGERAMEERSYKFGLAFKSDAALEKELAKAQQELEAVNANPLASEADREKARGHVAAVIAEMDRRD